MKLLAFPRPFLFVCALVTIIAGVFAWRAFPFKWGTYYTRTSIVIDTPEGRKEASVVRRRDLTQQPSFGLAPGGSLTGELKGEALALEVMPGKWLFGLTNESGHPIPYHESDWPQGDKPANSVIRYYLSRPTGEGRDIVVRSDVVYEEIPEDATQEETYAIKRRNSILRQEIRREAYPGTLVAFTDINDPSTIQLVDLADLEATFGEDTRFVSGRYEYARGPETEGVIGSVVPLRGDFYHEDELDENERYPITAFAKTRNGWKVSMNWNLFKTR